MGSSKPLHSSPSSSIMDPGSISLTDSGSSSPPTAASSSPPLHHGLKFGRKIYFEDHAAASTHPQGPLTKPVRASPSSTSSSSKKGRVASAGGGGQVQGGQPPRCQVEGCKVDLSDAKAYYSRHKVCGMHSKSPKVIVEGMEQRFCQQCSRFHQLAEFDQVKRSCRRRLAGHNERRRKPPPGALLTSRYGRLSSVFENSSRSGGFMMDFTAHPRHLARDVWSSPRLSDRGPTSQMTDQGKFPLHHPWQQSCSVNAPPPNPLLQGSTGGGCSSFTSSGIPPGECCTGVAADSTCALSLLSNQPWSSSRSPASALSINGILPHQGTAALPVASSSHFPSASWGFKASDAAGGIQSDLGLGQFSQHQDNRFSGEVELSQQSRRQYVELDHSRAFDSSQQMHWSL